MSDKPTIVDLEREVEQAWNLWDTGGHDDEAREVLHRLAAYLHARRAARAAGYVPVMISQDTIEELRFLRDEHPLVWALFDDMTTGPGIKAFRMVVRDLMSVIMGDKP